MVEYVLNYDDVFQALSDGNRRDMLLRVLEADRTISELAKEYSMSFAGVAKHVSVLYKARLIHKKRQGREQIITVNAGSIIKASELLKRYEQLWSERFDRLDEVLKEEE